MAYCKRNTSCRCPESRRCAAFAVHFTSRTSQFTVQRFFRQLLCCCPRLEKLSEVKHEDCYEKELSDAAMAAATGAATAQNQNEDKRLTQYDERQLTDIIGKPRNRNQHCCCVPASHICIIRHLLRH